MLFGQESVKLRPRQEDEVRCSERERIGVPPLWAVRVGRGGYVKRAGV